MGAGAKYTYLTLAQAFEYTVLEYPFLSGNTAKTVIKFQITKHQSKILLPT